MTTSSSTCTLLLVAQFLASQNHAAESDAAKVLIGSWTK